MKSYIYTIIIGFGIVFTNCTGDLDTTPLDEDVITSNVVYDDANSYRQVLAKLYAGLAVSGQQGPAGQSDIEGIDEGFGQYLRGYWYHQELPTDEAIIGWNDQTIGDFHDQKWTADDGFIFAFYSRVFYQVSLCNEFIRETAESKLDERGVSGDLRQEIQRFRAEARFLRSLSYWHALDLFRNVPFVTEEDGVGAFFPEQIQAAELFNYIESELQAIESEMADPRANEYGRADVAAAWMLLAKLYLNAEQYIGSARNEQCLEVCNKIINAGFDLDPVYQNMFLADNHSSPEFIFAVPFDGVNTRTWGGMTFIIRAGIGGSMDPNESGVVSGWGGTRTTRQLVELFGDLGGILVSPNAGNTVQYPRVFAAGDFQGWVAGDADASLTSPNSDQVFEGHIFFPEGQQDFLFTRVPSFSLSFGDADNDGILERGDDTITAPESGLYSVSVNFSDLTYSLEPASWGIIGDATPLGWDEDIDMEWDAELGALKVVQDLNVGALKFRRNDNWDVSLGDNDADAVLDFDGDNIIINEAGPYEILLFINKPDYTFQLKNVAFDSRGIFFDEGQNLDIVDVTQFTEGYAVQKFKNITSTGELGSDTDFPDTDFPMFRLADAYLMAAEAIVRSQGDRNTALEYVNIVRNRAYNGGGSITDAELTLNFLRDERAREFYWECHRRTDLIRFGSFSNTDYMWAWKGGTPGGKPVEDFRDIFPIPTSDIGANPNLNQNPGY